MHTPNAEAFERGNYLSVLQHWRPRSASPVLHRSSGGGQWPRRPRRQKSRGGDWRCQW